MGGSHLQTSLLVWCFWGDVQSHLTSVNGVYCGIHWVQFWSHLNRLYYILPVLNRLVPMLCSKLSKVSICFFFRRGERAYRQQCLSALLIVFSVTIVSADSTAFWSSLHVALGQFFVIILFIPVSEFFQGAPGIHCLGDTVVMRHQFIDQLGLNQLILICTDKGQDCFLITDRFQLVSWLLLLTFYTSTSVQYFPPVSFHTITHNLWTSMVWCLRMCGLQDIWC